MSFLSRFTGPKYNDEQLAHRATVAVKEDPLIDASLDVQIESEKGVVTISGTVHKEPEADRIEGDVRSTLRDAGLKFDRIENELEVHEPVSIV
mgnify:CR=1 FL=1